MLTVSDLTVGVGYAGYWNGRKQTVIKSVITCKQGLLQNEITLTNEDGLSTTVEQTLGVKKRASILKETVLEVKGNNVKVNWC